MAFKLITRNKLRVPVKGSIPDEDGNPVKFDFFLLCTRLNQTQIDEVLADKEAPIREFLDDVVIGWEGVQEESGEPLVFSKSAMDMVMEQPAMRTICFQAYLKAVGATSKN